MQEIKVALLGDSITEGLGSKKINYAKPLLENLNSAKKNYIIENFGASGTTIQYYFEVREKIEAFKPDIILIFYGNVEAIHRPMMHEKSLVYKLMPKRYKKNFSMIDPRPFYSHKCIKRFFQKIDSAYRFILKRYFIKKYGTYQILDIESFKRDYKKVLSELVSRDYRTICISNVRIDDYYFPKSSKALAAYRDVIKNAAEEFDCQYIDLYNWQVGFSWGEIYGEDHFHPNERGYNLIGKFFAKNIEKD